MGSQPVAGKYRCPFRIVVDTAEQSPFAFANIKGDHRCQYRMVAVETVWRCLGRHPDSFGDYTIEDRRTGELFTRQVAVERKSLDDAHGTILGWTDGQEDSGRRERFERELDNLRTCCSCVVVECTFADLVRSAPSWGGNTRIQNARILYTSVIAYQQDYRVPWLFCEDRRQAEIATFRWFWRWWRKGRKRERTVRRAPITRPAAAELF